MPDDCKWFKPANIGAAGSARAYVADFPPDEISGVYAIASNATGEVFYVGESHTDQLRKTLQRHFQIWNDQQQERAVYDRHRVQICWIETAPEDSERIEEIWMLELEPRDNYLMPEDEPDLPDEADYSEVPF